MGETSLCQKEEGARAHQIKLPIFNGLHLLFFLFCIVHLKSIVKILIIIAYSKVKIRLHSAMNNGIVIFCKILIASFDNFCHILSMVVYFLPELLSQLNFCNILNLIFDFLGRNHLDFFHFLNRIYSYTVTLLFELLKVQLSQRA